MRCTADGDSLHDDLRTICLNKELVATPPIELWPQVITCVPVPQDIEHDLLMPLREQQL